MKLINRFQIISILFDDTILRVEIVRILSTRNKTKKYNSQIIVVIIDDLNK